MVLERIYVVRHGFRSSWTVNPQTGTYSGIPSPTGIPGDPALTSYGIDQSKQLARHLMTLDPKVDKVYSSPFYRCLQTMAPFMELQKQLQLQQAEDNPGHDTRTLTGAPGGPGWGAASAVTTVLPEHGIREWFGSAPFRHPEPAGPEVLKRLFPSYDDSYVSTVKPSARGESLEQLQDRVTRALRGIIEQCDADGTRTIVLCSHAAVIILMGRILTGQVPASVDVDDFHAYTCGVSLYSRRKASSATGGRITDDSRHGRDSASSNPDDKADVTGNWDCDLNSDCSFLSGGQERGWRFSGDESFPDTGSLSQTVPDSRL
ncbi:uncharacterized protein UV8b_03665 [Ustilaginoidea virens]|uniref:Phosphoglycerate mutase family protein n=1 Tax=Ustilaginoidea virens TaxID=1159556 RepID=A0A8E5HQS2_USTVR|nr:uncharacterized protein UV8b_03665 [Ustilaginoidea virens]QUC19424.1 hypothetical protein UV8b_03665 [Ustilaginoidea virens]